MITVFIKNPEFDKYFKFKILVFNIGYACNFIYNN